VNLLIEDNGAGFDLKKAAGKGGLGLVSIHERVRLAAGTCRSPLPPDTVN
jgi:signal transduction histidine kinase